MKHAYFSDELQLRRKMLFRLLLRFDFDNPQFPAGGRIQDMLPNPKGVHDIPDDASCLSFLYGPRPKSQSVQYINEHGTPEPFGQR